MSTTTIYRTTALLSMAITFIVLTVATMSTDWRQDKDDHFNVFVTLGLWRICRDVTYGATVDHKCFDPGWYHCVRVMMMISLLLTFSAFITSIYLIVSLPAMRKGFPSPHVSMVIPALVMVVAAGCAFLGILVFAISTSTGQGLYFPDGLEPSWGDSWADVWSQQGSLPVPNEGGGDLEMKYGYSFALGCVSIFTTTASFVVNCIVSM